MSGHEMFRLAYEIRRSPLETLGGKIELTRRLLERTGHTDLAPMLGLDDMEDLDRARSEPLTGRFVPRVRGMRTTPKYAGAA